MQRASDFLGPGSLQSLEEDEVSEMHIVLSPNTPKRWTCIQVELLALAESFARLHLDGEPFVRFERVPVSSESG